ncbi:hypothetical protein C8R45DRAFT_933631 [Mycena sanguinolenta]|nr:hypothetical protein C8R45DRAFT_933631 [Mycena sanguinolenta]
MLEDQVISLAINMAALSRRTLCSGKEFSIFDLAAGPPVSPPQHFSVEDCLKQRLDTQNITRIFDEPADIRPPSPLSDCSPPPSPLLGPSLLAFSTTPPSLFASESRDQQAQPSESLPTSVASKKQGSKRQRKERREQDAAESEDPNLKSIHQAQRGAAKNNAVPVNVDAARLPHTGPGWIGKLLSEHGSESPTVSAPPIPRLTIPLIDSNRRSFALLGGKPRDLVGWQEVTDGAAKLMAEASSRGHFTPEDWTHCRAHDETPFPSVSCGLSHGGGQTALFEFMRPEYVSSFSPKWRCLQLGTVVSNSHLLTAYSPPAPLISVLERALSHIWTLATWPRGGSTILIPSAILRHSNIPVRSHETRFSFTQYTAGGLFRWIQNGFMTDEAFTESASPSEKELRELDAAVEGRDDWNVLQILSRTRLFRTSRTHAQRARRVRRRIALRNYAQSHSEILKVKAREHMQRWALPRILRIQPTQSYSICRARLRASRKMDKDRSVQQSLTHAVSDARYRERHRQAYLSMPECSRQRQKETKMHKEDTKAAFVPLKLFVSRLAAMLRRCVKHIPDWMRTSLPPVKYIDQYGCLSYQIVYEAVCTFFEASSLPGVTIIDRTTKHHSRNFRPPFTEEHYEARARFFRGKRVKLVFTEHSIRKSEQSMSQCPECIFDGRDVYQRCSSRFGHLLVHCGCSSVTWVWANVWQCFKLSIVRCEPKFYASENFEGFDIHDQRSQRFYYVVRSGIHAGIYTLQRAAENSLLPVGQYDILRCHTIQEAVEFWRIWCYKDHRIICDLQLLAKITGVPIAAPSVVGSDSEEELTFPKKPAAKCIATLVFSDNLCNTKQGQGASRRPTAIYPTDDKAGKKLRINADAVAKAEPSEPKISLFADMSDHDNEELKPLHPPVRSSRQSPIQITLSSPTCYARAHFRPSLSRISGFSVPVLNLRILRLHPWTRPSYF